MKKALLALGVAALLSGPAFAISLTTGDFELHLKDATSLYVDHDNDPSTPRIPRQSGALAPGQAGFAADTPTVGDESRSLFYVDGITQTATVGVPVGELTGLLHDIYIAASSPGNIGPQVIFNFTNSTASVAGPNPVVAFYLDGTVEQADASDLFNPNGDQAAPLLWVEDGYAPGFDSYTGVNDAGDDATPWLICELLPLFVDANGAPIYLQTFVGTAVIPGNNGIGGTLGNFYLDVIGGSLAPLIQQGVYDSVVAGADLSAKFTTAANPAIDYTTTLPFAFEGGWGLESSDPIQGAVIPEPASLTLLGLGIAGLLGYRRRK